LAYKHTVVCQCLPVIICFARRTCCMLEARIGRRSINAWPGWRRFSTCDSSQRRVGYGLHPLAGTGNTTPPRGVGSPLWLASPGNRRKRTSCRINEFNCGGTPAVADSTRGDNRLHGGDAARPG
jgi:hypothetical protein